jgi:type I restriction enzyme R subunit
MEHRIGQEDEKRIIKTSGGLTLKDLSRRLVDAVNPDIVSPSPVGGEGGGEGAALQARIEAVKPLHDPKLRELLVEIKTRNEVTIDHISKDRVIEAAFSADSLDKAKRTVESFEQFIKEHKDEITALQILYSRPYKQRLKFEDVKELADAIEKPPYLWNESQLWQAYAALEKSRVKGASAKRILTDLVSLVRFATHQENELVPFPERVNANFKAWLATQERGGKRFTQEQMRWLEMIRDHVAANLSIEPSDFDYAPFAQQGGIGKGHQLFGDGLNAIIEELNVSLAA